jgi:hypothetical protein
LTNKRGPLATRLHIKEKQDEMFPKVKKAKVDTAALGVELLQHKQELQAEMPIGNEGGPERAKGADKECPRKPAARAAR